MWLFRPFTICFSNFNIQHFNLCCLSSCPTTLPYNSHSFSTQPQSGFPLILTVTPFPKGSHLHPKWQDQAFFSLHLTVAFHMLLSLPLLKLSNSVDSSYTPIIIYPVSPTNSFSSHCVLNIGSLQGPPLALCLLYSLHADEPNAPSTPSKCHACAHSHSLDITRTARRYSLSAYLK